MTRDDLEFVLELERETFPSPWTAEHFLHELERSLHSRCWIARVSGERIGYACVWQIFGELRILNLALARNHRGAGFGRILLRFAMDHALGEGCEIARLEVRASNSVARALYASLGFVEVARQQAYYENGEEALILEAILAQ